MPAGASLTVTASLIATAEATITGGGAVTLSAGAVSAVDTLNLSDGLTVTNDGSLTFAGFDTLEDHVTLNNHGRMIVYGGAEVATLDGNTGTEMHNEANATVVGTEPDPQGTDGEFDLPVIDSGRVTVAGSWRGRSFRRPVNRRTGHRSVRPRHDAGCSPRAARPPDAGPEPGDPVRAADDFRCVHHRVRRVANGGCDAVRGRDAHPGSGNRVRARRRRPAGRRHRSGQRGVSDSRLPANQIGQTSTLENAGTLTLQDNSNIGGDPSAGDLINDTGATLDYDGSSAGATADITAAVTNAGSITVEQGILRFDTVNNTGDTILTGGAINTETYSQSAGSTSIGEAAALQVGDGSGTLALTGGSLSGSGTAYATVNGSGTVDPSQAGAPLTITGNDTFGQLIVDSDASLAGTLAISTTNGYLPPIGTTVTILDATSVSGTFAQVSGTQLIGEHWQVQYTASSVTLTAVSG